jgi:hypothetical protein
MHDETIDRLRARTLAAVRKADIRRRRVHRGVLSAIAIVVAASLTAGGFALAAPEPPPPLDPDIALEQYQGGIAEQWAELQERYPDAVRPNVRFVRFITSEEEPVVIAACLREQGIPAVLDENGVSTVTPIGQEQEYDLAWFACAVQFPVDPSEYQPLTDDEMYYLYRFYVDEQVPCLEALGYEISTPPGFDDFRARWWSGEMWAPYTEVAVSDFATFEATQDACPPLPPELRP